MLETARRIGAEYGLDYWRALDEQGAYPSEMWRAICAAGFGGIALPEEHGGAGLGMLDQALVIEALCEAGAGATLAQIFMVNPIFGGVAIARYGSDAMRRALLPPLIAGDIQCCMALTEPDAGTNTLELRTFAEAHGNGWRLNGRKIWISAVPAADKMLVVARTRKVEESARRTDGISLFLIDVEREGLSHSTIEKAGTHCVPASNVYFDDTPVAGDELVGTLHGGWRELLDVLNTERIVTTAGLVGTVRLALGLAVDYANGRRVFGERPISSYQGLQFPLAQAKGGDRVRRGDEPQGRRPARCGAALRLGGQHGQAHRRPGGRRGNRARDAGDGRHGLRQGDAPGAPLARRPPLPLRAGLGGNDTQLHRRPRLADGARLLRGASRHRRWKARGGGTA